MPEYVNYIVTLSVVILLIIGLYRELLRPVILFGLAAATFFLLGIINIKELLSGFANEQVAVIILLLIISSIIQRAGLITHWLNRIFRQANSYRSFSTRLMLFASTVSGFLNNTPIVATFIPYVFSWGKRNKIAPSKLLMPLSFAAILGGTMTLIGTSTNLIVNGLYIEYGHEGFALFDFIYIGLPLVVLGFVYMYFFGNRLLPDRGDALKQAVDDHKEFLVETRVKDDSSLVNKTVEDADLRSLEGLYLVEIIRDGRKIGPVKPSQNIRAGDDLIFAGETDTLPDLLKSDIGLELPKLRDIPEQDLIRMVEAVIPYNSPLVGKTVRESNFRGVYDAAIVAIHRNGERLSGKIGDIQLQSGDLLVMMSGKDFENRLSHNAFYLLSSETEIANTNKPQAYLMTFGALAAVLLAAIGLIKLFTGLLLFIALCLLLKWIRPGEIQKSLDLNLAFIAALSLAIGQAMTSSGTAEWVATSFTGVLSGMGPLALLAGLYLLTNLLTEFVTNVAAATIIFPIAYSVAQAQNLPLEPFLLCIAYAASASFLSPIGYQTNLMVLGAGSYRFKDYFRFGLPLSIICFITVVLMLGWRYNLL